MGRAFWMTSSRRGSNAGVQFQIRPCRIEPVFLHDTIDVVSCLGHGDARFHAGYRTIVKVIPFELFFSTGMKLIGTHKSR